MKPTATLTAQIVAFVRAGVFPEVAAEAAGVDRRTFHNWLRYGRRADRAGEYQAFAEAVMVASAQARATAEIETLNHRPYDWLRNGPGKPSAHMPGWTGVTKPPPQNQAPPSILDDPDARAALATAMQLLQPFPELAAALAKVFSADAEATTEEAAA